MKAQGFLAVSHAPECGDWPHVADPGSSCFGDGSLALNLYGLNDLADAGSGHENARNGKKLVLPKISEVLKPTGFRVKEFLIRFAVLVPRDRV